MCSLKTLYGYYHSCSFFGNGRLTAQFELSVHPSTSPGLFQNAQENHGLAVPTPSVPEDFADKEVGGKRTLILWLPFIPAGALKLKQNKTSKQTSPFPPAGGKASIRHLLATTGQGG